MEAQTKPSDCTCKIIETLNPFNINFNNNENKFLSLRMKNIIKIFTIEMMQKG